VGVHLIYEVTLIVVLNPVVQNWSDSEVVSFMFLFIRKS